MKKTKHRSSAGKKKNKIDTFTEDTSDEQLYLQYIYSQIGLASL